MQQPAQWKLRFAPNIGLNSLDTPMFRGCVGGLDPVLHVDFIADQGFAGVEDNFLTLREPVEQAVVGVLGEVLEAIAEIEAVESAAACLIEHFVDSA